MSKIIELFPWKSFLDVHLKKAPGLFPEYIAAEYNVPYEIVFMDANPSVSTKKTTLNSYGTITRITPPTIKMYGITLYKTLIIFLFLLKI